MIDRNEDGSPIVEPFYTDTELLCESCGHPVQTRTWDAEYGLWIGIDCSCNTPDDPVCPLLIPSLERAETVGEVCDVIREHRKHCPVCGPSEIRKQAEREHREATKRREAA
jgi:hypothetical protein